LDTVRKFGPLSENSTPLLVSQAGYGPAVKCSADNEINCLEKTKKSDFREDSSNE